MIRKAFLMSVQPEAVATYRQRHDALWPEMRDLLKDHGVHNYSIFLDRSRGLLFGYVEVDTVERWSAIAQTPACQRWWAFMSDIMPSNPDNSPISQDLEEVFHLA